MEVWESGWSAILDPQPTFVTFDQSTLSFAIVADDSDTGYAYNSYAVNFIIETYAFGSTDLSQRFQGTFHLTILCPDLGCSSDPCDTVTISQPTIPDFGWYYD